MVYDGVVIKMKKRGNKLFLFPLNPDTDELMDGINISEHKCYDNLNSSQLMVVNVIFKDGSEELETINLDEFIHGDKYGRYDTFLFIQDIVLYSMGEGDNNEEITEMSLETITERGDLGKIALKCIQNSKLIIDNEL